MKVRTLMLVILGLILMCSAANAANVQYVIDSSTYEKSNGTTISSCDNITGWECTDSTFTQMANSTISIDGTGSIQLTHMYNTSMAGGWIRQTFQPMNLSSAKNVGVYLYIEDISNVNQITFRFSSVTDESKNLSVNINKVLTSQRIRNGWNMYVIDTSRFSAIGGDTWNNSMQQVYVKVFPENGKTATVIVDRVFYDYNIDGNSTVAVTFDDGVDSVYSIAYPIMKERGIVGTAYVITSRIGSDGYMTIPQLVELRNAGWDIGSHTYSHQNIDSMTANEFEAELGGSFGWLVSQNMGLSSAVIAYPHGNWNATALTYVDDYYLLGRSTNISTMEMHIQNVSSQMILTTQQYNVYNTIPASVYNTAIIQNEKQHGMLTLLFHNISEAGDGGFYDVSRSNFTAIMDCINASDSVSVVMTDYIRGVVPDNRVVLNETVRVMSDNTVALLTGNTYPGALVDNFYITCDGSANVTVSEWTTNSKIWTESSESHDITTSHIIGGFPANTDIDIYRDGIDYATVHSNSTGYITWVYDGGFSEHTFEAVPHATAGMRDSFVDSWGNTVSMVGAIIVIALAGSMIAVFRGKREVTDLVNDLPGIILIVVLLVTGAIIFGQF